MIKAFNKKDIDIIMKIWKDNNQKFQHFINNQYWFDKYLKVRDEFLSSKIYVYTEAAQIMAFVVIDNYGRISNIQVRPEIQREGIGTLLIEKIKKENDRLELMVYEKNITAVMFFKSIGFKKIQEQIEEETKEKLYYMEWGKANKSNVQFIYFDNSISDSLIEKYDKLNKIQFCDVHTISKETNNVFNIDISNDLQRKNNKIVIKDYIEVRNKLNSVIKNNNTVIYFDCNNDYSFLFEVIKDIVKVRNIKLNIIMHKPFSVEGTKKMKVYQIVQESFQDFNMLEIDYEEIGRNQNITFKEAFDRRDEEMLKKVCEL